VQWVTAKLERHGLNVTVVDDGRPKPLDPDMLRIAHQSLHELLFNVLKHAGTTSAKVRIRRVGRAVAIQVLDRGAGIIASRYKTPTQQGGFGLFNMREQVAGAGGLMRLSSLAQGGTRATIVLPLRVLPVSTMPVPGTIDFAGRLPAMPSSAEESPVHIRILLVDDHQIMRQGLRTMIETEQGYDVVGEAVDGQMAVELAAALRPNVILMDINMPKLNGVEATRRIKQAMPGIAIIGLSMHEDPKLEQLMFEAGASAYLSKGTAFNLVCDTIRQVFAKEPSAHTARTTAAIHS